MPIVNLILPHHRYEIVIQTGSLDRLGELSRRWAAHSRCGLFGDERVMSIHGRRAAESLHRAGYEVALASMAPGEEHKTLDSVRRFYDAALEARLERRSPILAMGGGVAGDCIGFAAATYLRGVPFIQVPTTLLSMVDASVGGKVGVNVPQGKNLIGSFHQPVGVVIDPATLQTLPPRELRCGLAECVKHAIIRDGSLFDWIDANVPHIQALKTGVMEELVARNVQIKADVVMEDEKETSVRAHLNFGHTFAHAIEATTGYGVIEHGEAVGLGMVAATELAAKLGRCPTELPARLRALLLKIGLPVAAKLAGREELMAAMMLDKKVKDNRLRLILPDRMGMVSIVDDVPVEKVAQAWDAIL